jgi:hypothetical protein
MREAPHHDLARAAQTARPHDDNGGLEVVGDRHDPPPDGPVDIDALARVKTMHARAAHRGGPFAGRPVGDGLVT